VQGSSNFLGENGYADFGMNGAMVAKSDPGGNNPSCNQRRFQFLMTIDFHSYSEEGNQS
jgi:hypothetical protein